MNKKLLQFLNRQISQIVEGGESIFIEKLLKICKILFYLPFAIVILIIVRLSRPVVVIRFGELYSDRIGHFAIYPELYLCERDKGIHGKNKHDIFYFSEEISNHQLKKMWSRVLNISTLSGVVELIVILNRFFPGYQKHLIILESSTDTYDFYANTPPHLYFNQKEEYLGSAMLRKLGILEDVPFVCFHARDSAYLNTSYPFLKGPSFHYHQDCNLKDWSYHNHRDSNIGNYIAAAEELASRGYFVFRMGAIVKEPLVNANPRIIDYATKYRTDFLDIFLPAKCKFFVGSVSGIDEVPKIFRRKVACVNCIPIEYVFIWNHISLFIPKKPRLKKDNRFLTFREIIEWGIGRFDCSGLYDKHGIEVVENTPAEISGLVIEMDERLKGTWVDTKEDKELQEQFWHILKLSKLYRNISTRIGAEFLRQNVNLLE